MFVCVPDPLFVPLVVLPELPLFVDPLDELDPVLMVRCTVLPGARLVPAVGVWLITQPEETDELAWYSVVTWKPSLVSVVVAVPSLWPTTLGTCAVSEPLLTTMFTVPSAFSFWPDVGDWLMTVPSATVLEYCVSTVT